MSISLNSQTKKALVEILKFSLENPYSDFYRRKYAPLKLKHINEDNIGNIFVSLPLLTKDDLLASPPFDRIFTKIHSPYVISSTSGTTGKGPVIIFINTPSETAEGQLTWGKINAQCGLFLFPPGVQWQLLTTMIRAFPVYIGNPYQMKETAEIASRIKIDTIATTPTALQHFLIFLEPAYDISKIKHILFRGEPLSKAQQTFFRNKFPNAIFNLLYGMREAGQIGVQCDVLSMREEPIYHLRSDKFFIEILPAENEEAGELVLTHLRKDPTLLIRYRTGDLGWFLRDEKCSCELNFPLFKLFGRNRRETIHAGGVVFEAETFNVILKDFLENIQNNFEAHFYQRLIQDKIQYDIVVRVIPKGSVNEMLKIRLEESLNNRLRISNRFSFSELIRQDLFSPIKVEFADPDTQIYKMPLLYKLVSHF
ncbi:MAG: AMP-binding protein [Candidatus Sungbacteria bacterium]|nr:AMP-binding protein [Candidatus Sungbacteria bacterium]